MKLRSSPTSGEHSSSHMSTLTYPTIVSRIVQDGPYLTHHIRSSNNILIFLFIIVVLQVNALSILPSPQAETFVYPPAWEFKVFPRPDVKYMSEKVTCELRIAAGKTKLASQRFHHDRPPSYCKLYEEYISL